MADTQKPILISKHLFPSGPGVSILLLPKKEKGVQVTLTESTIFTASFFVDLPPSLTQNLLDWLEAYSLKKATPFLILPQTNTSFFSKNVIETLKTVPFGKTLSYGELAVKSGSPKASRAVGTICRLNSWPLFIPCHRVLPKNGSVGKYAFGSPIKTRLLEFERVI